jgi:hypothetical protein
MDGLTMKKKPPLESAIQTAILDYLLTKGYFVWRSNNAPIFDAKRQAFRAHGKYAPKGLPDICGVLGPVDDLDPGRALFVEVKRPGGKLRPDQKAFMDKATAKGARCLVAFSLQDVIDAGL